MAVIFAQGKIQIAWTGLFAQVTWKFWRAGKGMNLWKEWNLDAMLCAHFACTSCYQPIYWSETFMRPHLHRSNRFQTKRWRPMILGTIIFWHILHPWWHVRRTCRRSISWPSITQRNEKKNESWLYHRVSTIYILYVWISQGLRLPSTANTFPGQISVRKKNSTPDIPWWTWIAPHLCPRCACQRWKVVMPGASGFWWRRCFLLRCFGWWDSFGDVFLIFLRVFFFWSRRGMWSDGQVEQECGYDNSGAT